MCRLRGRHATRFGRFRENVLDVLRDLPTGPLGALLLARRRSASTNISDDHVGVCCLTGRYIFVSLHFHDRYLLLWRRRHPTHSFFEPVPGVWGVTACAARASICLAWICKPVRALRRHFWKRLRICSRYKDFLRTFDYVWLRRWMSVDRRCCIWGPRGGLPPVRDRLHL